MTTEERLTTIAENVAKVYEAGKAAATGGNPTAIEKDVNFLDYDGTLLYSYTLAEAQALTELPPLPKQDGLICQEWNWDLADIKALGRKVDVGATYTTDDGTTRLHIEMLNRSNLTTGLQFVRVSNFSLTIDWGDGTDEQTVSAASTVTHTYPAIGRYTVTITVLSGQCNIRVTSNTTTKYIRVELGDNVGLYYNGFSGALLGSITIPRDFLGFGSSDFYQSTLKGAVIPKGKSPGVSTFQLSAEFCCVSATLGSGSSIFYSSGIKKLTIPDSLTAIGSGLFRNCKIQEIDIPAGVTTIGANAFNSNTKLCRMRFWGQVPPTIENANAFTGVDPSRCVIEVPAGCLEAYTTATNYPSAETYTYVEVDE